MLQRLLIDALGRTVCIFTSPPVTPGGAPTTIVLVLELGGGVTVAEGLLSPSRHVLSGLPTRLHSARAALIATRGEAVRLFAEAAALAAGAGQSTWATTLATRLSCAEGAPLDWSPDSHDVAATWARHFTLGVDPLIPCTTIPPPASWKQGMPESRRTSRFSHELRRAHAGLSSFSNSEGGVGAAAMAAAAATIVERWPLHAVLYWSPCFVVWCVDPHGASVTGLAWRILPPIHHSSATHVIDAEVPASAPGGLGPLVNAVPDMDVFPLAVSRPPAIHGEAIEDDAVLTWTRLSRGGAQAHCKGPPHGGRLFDGLSRKETSSNGLQAMQTLQAALRDPSVPASVLSGLLQHALAGGENTQNTRLDGAYSLLSSPDADYLAPEPDARELRVRALLVASHWLDPRAAHAPTVRLASILRSVRDMRAAVGAAPNPFSSLPPWQACASPLRLASPHSPAALQIEHVLHSVRADDENADALFVSTGFDDALGPGPHELRHLSRPPILAAGGALTLAAHAARRLLVGGALAAAAAWQGDSQSVAQLQSHTATDLCDAGERDVRLRAAHLAADRSVRDSLAAVKRIGELLS